MASLAVVVLRTEVRHTCRFVDSSVQRDTCNTGRDDNRSGDLCCNSACSYHQTAYNVRFNTCDDSKALKTSFIIYFLNGINYYQLSVTSISLCF